MMAPNRRYELSTEFRTPSCTGRFSIVSSRLAALSVLRVFLEIVRNSVESQRRSVYLDYAAAA